MTNKLIQDSVLKIVVKLSQNWILSGVIFFSYLSPLSPMCCYRFTNVQHTKLYINSNPIDSIKIKVNCLRTLKEKVNLNIRLLFKAFRRILLMFLFLNRF